MTGNKLAAAIALVLGLAAPALVHAQQDTELTPNQIANKAQFLCSLSGVRGYFGDHDSDGGSQYVALGGDSTNYKLVAGAGRTGWALCVPWSFFLLPSGGTHATGYSALLERNDINHDFSATLQTWWGDAATMVEQVNGEFDNKADYVRINQSLNPNAPSTLEISSIEGDLFSSTDMRSTAQSVFVGNSNNHRLVKMIGININGVTQVTTAASTTVPTQFKLSTESGFSSWWLADVSGPNGGFCYLSQVNGDFQGAPDSIRIRKIGTRWFAEVIKHSASDGVHGQVRCMAYDQR